MEKTGTLYIVATPIGNLGDMTFRAVETLKSVSLVAAEDTRKAGILLKHFNIDAKLTSYFDHNEREKSGGIIDFLQRGEDVALISEAGTPSISDPGYRLINKVADAGIKIVPIPGATAAIAALSVSGLPTDSFYFVGFLPDKQGKRRTKLGEIKDIQATLIFYISKWKVEKVLADILEVLGDRRAAYCRELTKMFEEVKYADISGIIAEIKNKPQKGEITLVVRGK